MCEQPQEVPAPVCHLHVLGRTTIDRVNSLQRRHPPKGRQPVCGMTAWLLAHLGVNRIDSHFSTRDDAFACAAATTATAGTWLIALTTHCADATTTMSHARATSHVNMAGNVDRDGSVGWRDGTGTGNGMERI